jgi:hypothetical protein
MLQTVDTIISFAVIMTVLSLLITIIVQMVSAALALRGKNLANALSVTFQTIDPSLRQHAHGIAEYILKDPIFSDSLLRKTNRRGRDEANPLAPEEKALLAAQSATQQVQRQLAEAESLLQQAKQAVDSVAAQDAAARVALAKAKQVGAQQAVIHAEAVLETRALTMNAGRKAPWRFRDCRHAMALATAVRPGEVYRVLHDLNSLSPEDAMERGVPLLVKIHAGKLLRALRVPDGPALEAEEKLAAVANLAKQFGEAAQQKAVLDALASFGATVERASTQSYDRFQRWFGSAQDRAEQWFRAHVRATTVCASIAVAGLLQLDTIEILRELRSNPAAVQALLRDVAPVVLGEGERVLDPYGTPAFYAYQAWLEHHPLHPVHPLPEQPTREAFSLSIAEALKRSPIAAETSGPVSEFRRIANEMPLAEAVAAWGKRFPQFKPPSLEAKLNDDAKADEVAAQIAAQVRAVREAELGPDPAQHESTRAKWLAQYDTIFASGRAYLEARREGFKTLKNALEEAGLNLVPPSFLGRWNGEPSRPVSRVLGMAITAGLLSLGAPFWFNLLKNMMSLRPAVATLIERRPQSAPALPSAPSVPTPSN